MRDAPLAVKRVVGPWPGSTSLTRTLNALSSCASDPVRSLTARRVAATSRLGS
jgi:hypothetical protein